MGNLRWDESPHWNKPDMSEPVIELPKPQARRTRHEIADAVRDDPRYNAINPNMQEHIIGLAIAEAEKSGMLIEEGEYTNARSI